jgi:membrane dipeptidase
LIGCVTSPAQNVSVNAEASNQRLTEIHKMLREVPLIDGHNDTPWQIRTHTNEIGSVDLAQDTRKLVPPMVTDIPRLRIGGLGGQFWSVFVPQTITGPAAVQAVIEQIDVVHQMVERYPQTFELALTAADVERIHRKGKIASLIGMEGGHCINNSLATLRETYALGARYMTLTHVKNNDWADSATDEPLHHGLTAFGEQVIHEMNRLGMLVDLSHVSDETMRAALRISKAPVIFSHSSARAVCAHRRNVPDDILKLTAANGGVVMVCFLPSYVTETQRSYAISENAEQDRLKKTFPDDTAKVEAGLESWRHAHPEPQAASLADVADHIDHLRKVMGVDHIGIGSDFDGYRGTVAGLEDVSCYPALLAELMRRGYSPAEIKKIAGLNILRVLRQAEHAASEMK